MIPREIEESEYQRVADETLDGIPVFVVEVVPKPFAASEYSRVRVYVEKARFVPLRTRYWDDAGVEVKELRAVPSEIRNFDGRLAPDEGHHAQPPARVLHDAGGLQLRAESAPAAGDLRSLAPGIALAAGAPRRPG